MNLMVTWGPYIYISRFFLKNDCHDNNSMPECEVKIIFTRYKQGSPGQLSFGCPMININQVRGW